MKNQHTSGSPLALLRTTLVWALLLPCAAAMADPGREIPAPSPRTIAARLASPVINDRVPAPSTIVPAARRSDPARRSAAAAGRDRTLPRIYDASRELPTNSRALPSADLFRPEAGTTGASRRIDPAKATGPWSDNQLLANPTNMNDEYVSLAVSPLTGALYATFAATDLGGTDRDIHIARSTDDGVTWQDWELPAMSEDEYQPDLAIDDAGYIHVVWVAEPGVIMRARSNAPDDPVNWAFVDGLAADEPLATPSVCVSGGGDFARVFIAVGWNTVNWDYLWYEWTLLFMYSSDGGRNITYDWFLPDGYQDYWPDVTMDGSLVHFVNAEADIETGELEILIASDQHSGSFSDPALMTSWTPNNCLFPRIAGEGANVYVVYQHDWTDGFNTDGDVIYSYSQDAAASWFGPIGMAADEYESVGPSIFVDEGVMDKADLVVQVDPTHILSPRADSPAEPGFERRQHFPEPRAQGTDYKTSAQIHNPNACLSGGFRSPLPFPADHGQKALTWCGLLRHHLVAVIPVVTDG